MTLTAPATLGGELTGPGQAQLGELLLGAGTPYVIERVAGAGLPDVRDADTLRAIADGAQQDDDYLGARTIELQLSVRDTPEVGLGQALDVLGLQMGRLRGVLTQLAWWPRGSGAARYVLGKPRRLAYDAEGWRRDGLQRGVRLQVVCGDPRWYALAQQTAEVGLPTITGGREYPRTYPLAYGGGGTGLVTATNAGNAESYPVTTINGPILAPIIRNTTTGQQIALSSSLAEGQFLVLDHQARTVLLGGTASRYGELLGTPQWWPLVPGPNALTLNAAQGNGAFAAVTWRSAYLTA